ncbi:TetR/AcrR family transcriptional regulator [Mangrovimicrobium sediminis]|uniref:TetR/AcrR family transcriptional regulator n=1 Tax=Mangrovimicrobium sediminis TaxID=2562682 RepID=A0A4Z0M8G9_9GAMM|nr:TetR/AcrR family transcriptional regulator [Haliea sp. SAOS-164]TGD76003.1 TetR/AcrR family transcriptional regulator [Haliea sp. SAOS-164]
MIPSSNSRHRDNNDPPTDARALRSREALRAALLRLLETQSLEEISIRHIAAEAGVGHATFYRHYSGKEDLLDDVATAEIERLVSLSLPALVTTDSAAASLVFCEYIQDHWRVWSTLLTGGASAAMREELMRITGDIAEQWPHIDHWMPQDLRRALSIGMIIEILVWWLRQPSPQPAQEVALIFDRVIVQPLVNDGGA